ncbi:hypothetical protein ACFYUV_18720 [Nonomuraea sp. NPDC003560]|uniref:hypothetical protein n=1 Tax=Nonomuraea sp. NPDC003560 TaxID=3364341 RepID=UPI0036D093BF
MTSSAGEPADDQVPVQIPVLVASTGGDGDPATAVRVVGNVAILLGLALSVLTIVTPWQDEPTAWLLVYLVIALGGFALRIEAAVRARR